MKAFLMAVLMIVGLNAKIDVMEKTKDGSNFYTVICVNGKQFLVTTVYSDGISTQPLDLNCTNPKN